MTVARGREGNMFYEAKVGDAAPVGKTVAPASEVGADQDKLDELRGLIQGKRRPGLGPKSNISTRYTTDPI